MMKIPLPLLVVVALNPAFCAAAQPNPQPELQPNPHPQPKTKPLWLAVTRPLFADGLARLAEHRRADGFETVISTQPVGETQPVGAAPAACPDGRRPAYLLLVGDFQRGMEDRPWYMPTRFLPQYRWRAAQKKTFASDNAWADGNGDRLPDFPVGRIPARNPAELETAIDKIIAWERRPPCRDDLRVLFWAGSPMYGAAIDAAATGVALAAVDQYAPAWCEPSILTADRRYALRGWPEDQPAHFTRWLVRGAGLAVIMGHGDTRGTHSMRFRGRTVGYSAQAAGAALAGNAVAAPTIVFSCSSGDFAAPDRCLTEWMLLTPGGPVAAIGATADSHPLPNYNAGLAAIRLLGPRFGRVGNYWLKVARETARARNPLMEFILARAESRRGMNTDPARLNRDQPLLYALLGDPATKTRFPAALRAAVRRDGEGWSWRAEKPVDAGNLLVEIARGGGGRASSPGDAGDRRAWNESFRAAQASLGFRTLETIRPRGRWAGRVDTPGTLRLLCVGKRRLAVFTADLAPRTQGLQAERGRNNDTGSISPRK